MFKNLRSDLPPIDEKATRERVEKELERYLFYKITDFESERVEAKTTSVISDMPRSQTNVTSDPTASVAIKNVSAEEERKKHISDIDRAVSRLSKRQRELLRLRYLEEYGVYDLDVMSEMGIHRTTYMKIRDEAFYMLAFILKIYVIREGDWYHGKKEADRTREKEVISDGQKFVNGTLF